MKIVFMCLPCSGRLVSGTRMDVRPGMTGPYEGTPCNRVHPIWKSQQQLQTGGTTNITDSIMSNIFAASGAIMAPYSTAKLTMTVSQILLSNKTDGTCCQAKTDWKIANNGGTARPCQLLTPSNTAPVSITTIPTGFTTSSSTSGPIVVADVTYEDIPGFSFQLWHWKVWKTSNVAQTQYMRPRGSNSLVYQATTGTKCS